MFKSIEKYLSIFIILIPILIIFGPAIPDIIISLSAIYALINLVINRKFVELQDGIILTFFIFWLSIVISSIFSSDKFMSLSSSILYIRFIFFVVFVKLFFSNDILKKYNPFLLLTLCLSFVIIDTYLQFFFRVDILGNQLDNNLAVRLTGPFLHGEQIVGSYLSKFGYIAVGFILSMQLNKKSNDLIFYFFFALIYSIIFLSGERMAFILFNFGLIIYLLLNKNLFIKFLKIFFIILILISTTIFLSKGHVLKRALSTFDIFGIDILNKEEINNNNFFDSHYGSHLLTSIEIFKDQPLFGVGNKMYRVECSNEKYSNINSKYADYRCSTHPHNIYFQVIAENGIIGLITFILFIVFVFKKSYQMLNSNKGYLGKGIFVSIMILIWPFQSNGGLYNNRYATLFFFILSLIYLIDKNKSIDD